MRPPLIALDLKAMTARRYWPKPGDQRPATFLTQTAVLIREEGAPWLMGSEQNLALLEEFRTGKLDATPITDEELERA